jgi:hypothetical protein
MPKKRTAKRKVQKKRMANKPLARQKRTKKQTTKRAAPQKSTKKRATKRKQRARRFPSASTLESLSEKLIAQFITEPQSEDVEDPPGACITVDSSGRMTCRVTRQSMCTGSNSRFYPGKACPA